MQVIKVSEASGAVLDWLVENADLRERLENTEQRASITSRNIRLRHEWAPSVNWAQGGPIIDREIGNLWKHSKLDPNEPDVWTAAAYCKAPDGTMLYYEDGPTPLIAAMRCYVSSKLGDEVEVPEELCK